MGVDKNRGISPQIIHFNRVFHYKSSILGYLYFWKHRNHENIHQLLQAVDLLMIPPNRSGRVTSALFKGHGYGVETEGKRLEEPGIHFIHGDAWVQFK